MGRQYPGLRICRPSRLEFLPKLKEAQYENSLVTRISSETEGRGR